VCENLLIREISAFSDILRDIIIKKK